MKLSDYQKVTISRFNGWYARGDDDSVPPDHAVECSNMWLNDPGNLTPRTGSGLSFQLTHDVVNMFLATPTDGYHFLTMDPNGFFYDERANPGGGNSSVALIDVHGAPFQVPGAIDFVGLNMNGRTYLNIIKASGPPYPIQVFEGGTLVRNAAGERPVGFQMAISSAGGGLVSAGKHYIGVIYQTSSGFLTPIGPSLGGVQNISSFDAVGGEKITVGTPTAAPGQIPFGPPGTIARQLVMTKGDELQWFMVPDGLINDNSTTTKDITSPDQDLIVDASYLEDNLESIPGGIGDGGLNKYHGRLLSWGGEADLVRVSYSGDPETVSNVTGYIQLPSEFDGNYVKGGFVLRDVLYFTKGVGIYSTQDLNGDESSSWPITIIDGAKGSWNTGISTITSSQPGLSLNDGLLLTDWEGIHLFTGVVQQPALTWKINDVWKAIDRTKYQKITIAVDPFKHIIYVLVPSGPYYLLVGDYSEGLDAKNIKWGHWDFPFAPKSMALANVRDMHGDADWNYYLRLGTFHSSNGSYYITKLSPGNIDDFGTSPLISTYQTAYTAIETGSINVLRGVRLRAKGVNAAAGIGIQVRTQDDVVADSRATNLAATPNKDYFVEFNVMNEKFSLRLASAGIYNISRLDMFGGIKVKSRPA